MPVTQILLARLFGTVVFGAYQGSLALIEVLVRGGTGGADKAMLRYVAANRARGDEQAVMSVLGSGLRLCLMVAGSFAIAAFLAAPIIGRLLGVPALATSLPIMAPTILLTSFTYVLVQASLGAKVTRANLEVQGLGEPIFLFVAGMAAALVGRHLAELAAAYTVAEVSTFTLAVIMVGRVFAPGELRRAVRAPRARGFASFSLPIGLGEMLNAILQRADVIMLTAFEGAAAAGIYAACEILGRGIVGIRWAFDSVAASVLSESLQLGQRERLRYNLALMTRWVATVAAPVAMLIVFLRRELLGLFGPDFTAGSTAIVVLAAGHLVNAALGLVQWTLMVSGRSRLLLFNDAFCACLNVTLGLLWIPRFHLVGMAMAVLVATAALHTLALVQTWRTERVHPFELALCKPLVSSLAIPAVHELAKLWLTGGALVAVTIIGGLAAYGGVLALLGLPPETGSLFRRLRRR